ncbi:hypothetical protein, partial [Methylomagnum sp.]
MGGTLAKQRIVDGQFGGLESTALLPREYPQKHQNPRAAGRDRFAVSEVAGGSGADSVLKTESA